MRQRGDPPQRRGEARRRPFKYRRGSATVHCRIQGEAKKLNPALQHLDDLLSMQELPSAEPGVIAVSLTFEKTAMPEKQVFTLCSALGAPILRMTRHEDDLEQIFLQAIAE